MASEEEAVKDGPWLTIANEFTTVQVRKVLTRNGERLWIASARLGYAIELDPLELESLTWQKAETFSRFLETPYGPEDRIEARALSDLFVWDWPFADGTRR